MGRCAVTNAVATILLLAIVCYGVLAGADFGTGLWDLTAGGAEPTTKFHGVKNETARPTGFALWH